MMTPLILAAGLQYTEVVDLLLRDERVDPWRHVHSHLSVRRFSTFPCRSFDHYMPPEIRRFRYSNVEPGIRRGLHRRRMAQFRGMVRAKIAFRRLRFRAAERAFAPGAAGALSAGAHFEYQVPKLEEVGEGGAAVGGHTAIAAQGGALFHSCY